MIPTLEWTADGVRFLDQTRLPLEETYVLATTSDQVANVITTMVVRGAPAIGVAAAMGVALGIKNSSATTIPALTSELESISKTLAATRPTAVNLFWAIERMRRPFLRPGRPARHDHRRHSGRTGRRGTHHVRRGHRRLPHHGRPRRRADACHRAEC